jgi:virginiamycin B lyase
MPSNFDEQLERLLHRYADPVRPTRDTFAEIKERLRAKVELNGAGGHVEDDGLAFTLDDTLDDTLEDPMNGDEHHRSTTTILSPRLDPERRGLSPRATAIAALAAALILVIIAATIFTQLAVRRTPHPAATPTPSVINKIALPNASQRQINQWAAAPDGSLWFVESGGETATITHVALDGTVRDYTIPATDKKVPPGGGVSNIYTSTYGLAVALDGAAWVVGFYAYSTADDVGRFIYRVTPDGIFTAMPVPSAISDRVSLLWASAYGLAALFVGPDGGLWFSGPTGADIAAAPTAPYTGLTGEITPDGHLSAHPVQTAPGIPQTLCVGPDQAIWRAVLDPLTADRSHVSGRIERESPTGQIQEFTAPYAPHWIASGSDGALWFGEYSTFAANGQGAITGVARKGVIGRITTAGVASEIPIDPHLGVGQLVSGSDGAIWFTVDQDEKGTFARITPSGKVTMFTTGGNAGIQWIAAAPGGLWLLDGRNALWHYQLSA